MADNPLNDYLAQGLGQGNTAQEIMLRQQMAQQQMYANVAAQQMYMQQAQQMVYYGDTLNIRWCGEPEFAVEGGEGNAFVARYTCKTTGECFELTSLERSAVERGMRHLVGKWDSAIQHLSSAGLEKDEMAPSLAILRPRILADAQRQRDLEEGLQQAENKARALLVMCLTPEQKSEFKEYRRFTINVDHKVRGFPTGAFRIKKGSAFNVEHIESGETFCVVSQEKVPVYDQMLTQKLLLEQEPERFFKTANRSGGFGVSNGFDQYIHAALEGLARQYMQRIAP